MVREPNFWDLKVAALFHDPPWKPWIVTASFRIDGGKVGKVLARMSDRAEPAGVRLPECSDLVVGPFVCEDAHECEAFALLKNVWAKHVGGSDAGIEQGILRGNVIRVADEIAASMDRWFVMGKDGNGAQEIKDFPEYYVNILNPDYRIKLTREIDPAKICEYVKKLSELVKDLKDASINDNLVYAVLYAVREPLWYDLCPKCVPVADTRAPTHTVFDHANATASMVNWLLHCREDSKKACIPKGYLIKLDVAGIQQFISSARKVSDLWAGSWLVSALIWYTVSEAVFSLGPDVVLSPALEFNPFFIASLLNKVDRKEVSNLVEKIEDLLQRHALWQGAPKHPVMPGTIFIALPRLDDVRASSLLDIPEELKNALKDKESGIVNYFHRKFIEAWRHVVNKLTDKLDKVFDSVSQIEEKNLSKEEKEWRRLAAALHKFIGSDFKDMDEELKPWIEYFDEASVNPPLWLRVIVVDVEEAYHNLREALKIKFGRKATKPEEDSEEAREIELWVKRSFLHWLFAVELPKVSKERMWDQVKVTSSYMVHASIEDVTEASYGGRGPRIRFCTVCGQSPAIIKLPRNEEAFKEVGKKLRDKEKRPRVPQSEARLGRSREHEEGSGVPPTFFTPGEALCPYCLIKRVLRLRIKEVAKTLGMKFDEKAAGWKVLSTSELAAAEAVANVVSDITEAILSNPNLNKGNMPNIYGEEIPYPIWHIMQNKIRDEEIARNVYRMLTSGQKEVVTPIYDALFLGKEGLKELTSLIKSILIIHGLDENQAEKKARTIVDNARKVLRRYYAVIRGDGDFFGGRVVRGCLRQHDPEEYIVKVTGHKDSAITENVKKVFEAIRDSLRSQGIMTDPTNDLCSGGGDPTVVVTPTYYRALSRGQMISAITDSRIIEELGGLVVYAGGDDIAALAPVWVSNCVPEELEIENTDIKERFKDLRSIIPAAIAVATRRNYWGLLKNTPEIGFYNVGSAYYPASAVYGRSYGIMIAHHKDPFQAVWSLAGELEELKKHVKYVSGCDCEKDVSFTYYGRVQSLAPEVIQECVSVLPNYCGNADIGELYRTAGRLAESVDNGEISNGLFSHLGEYAHLARELARNKWMKNHHELMQHLIERVQGNQEIKAGYERELRIFRDIMLELGSGKASMSKSSSTSERLAEWEVIETAKKLYLGRR